MILQVDIQSSGGQDGDLQRPSGPWGTSWCWQISSLRINCGSWLWFLPSFKSWICHSEHRIYLICSCPSFTFCKTEYSKPCIPRALWLPLRKKWHKYTYLDLVMLQDMAYLPFSWVDLNQFLPSVIKRIFLHCWGQPGDSLGRDIIL